MTKTIASLYQKAQQLQQKRQYATAWELYQQILQADPTHILSMVAISRMLQQTKKYKESIPYLERVIQLQPLMVEAHYLLGIAYHKTQYPQTISIFKKVVDLTPPKSVQRSEALYQLAKVYRDQEEVEKAEKYIDRILAQHPNYAKALTLKGQFQQQREENEAAYENFQKAVRLMPQNAPANYNLANIAKVLDKRTEAIEYYEKAIALNAQWDAPLRELADVLSREGQAKQAELFLKKAVQVTPDNPENYRAIAQWYGANGDRRKAIKFYQKTVHLLPDDLAAHKALAASLGAVGAYEQAIVQYKKVYTLEKTASTATALASTLIAHQQLEQAGSVLEEALSLIPHYLPAIFQSVTLRAKLCNWMQRTEDEAAWAQAALQHIEQKEEDALPLLDLNFYNLPLDLNLQLNQYEAQNVNKRAAYIVKQTNFKHTPRHRERLRVGYISPDFRHHPVGRIVQNIFKAHHRSAVEVYAYSISETNKSDDVRDAIIAGVDHFRKMPFDSDTAVAKQIYQDEIDVLVDLGGYTAYCRPSVLAARPAPVQAHFLGYPNTSGSDFLQYIIGDNQLIPPSVEAFYSEKIVRLPHAFPGTVPYLDVTASSRAKEGLPEDAFVIAVFNRPEKYDPQTFSTWLDIVNAIPKGVLWLGVSNTVQRNIRAYAQANHLDTSRLKFSTWADYRTFLQRLQLADIFLDTFNYGAGATAVASIAMGTPVLTLTNHCYTSRLAASVASGAGQEELICPDLESYAAKAIELGNNPAEMATLREQLKNTEQLPLFDMDAFTRHLEAAYKQMYQLFKEGKTAANIQI